jgi:hypothetical protein
METQTWRRGNEVASQIIEKKVMRPHYEMHAAEYGFKFDEVRVSFVLSRRHETLIRLS